MVRNPNGRYTDWDWEIYPEGLTDAILRINKRYGNVPIYITENGLGAKDPSSMVKSWISPVLIIYVGSYSGDRRSDQAGCRCRGYYPWSFIDLLSWLEWLPETVRFCLHRP